MSEEQARPPAESEDKPEERRAEKQVEDLDVPEEEAHHVKGGITVRKAGKDQQEY
jgi:hypothetical protein